MPPRRPAAIRDTDDMVDDNALHVTHEQTAVFGELPVVLKKAAAEALYEKAAQADHFRQLAEQLQQQGAAGLAVHGDAIMLHGFQLTPTGLVAPENIERETWEQVGAILYRLEGSIQWLIGDWLVYGENLAYGDLIARVEASGHNYQTIRNYMVVCRAFELYRRRYNLSFGHYHAAASLPEGQQEEALVYAQEHGTSVAAFRKLVRDVLDGVKETPSLPAADGFKSIAKKASKFIERDPSTLKAEDRQAGLSYIAQMRSVFDAWEAKARS